MMGCRFDERNFNPRSPWGERLLAAVIRLQDAGISIHAPRGGSDGCCFRCFATMLYFNPRSPWGERPLPPTSHAPLACHFNPRSPWGERLMQQGISYLSHSFQSTLPVGGATRHPAPVSGQRLRFQSTLPVGGATAKMHRFSVSLWRGEKVFCNSFQKVGNSRGRRGWFIGVRGNKSVRTCRGVDGHWGFALRQSGCPLGGRSAWRQNVPPFFRSCCPGSRNAGCPFPGP